MMQPEHHWVLFLEIETASPQLHHSGIELVATSSFTLTFFLDRVAEPLAPSLKSLRSPCTAEFRLPDKKSDGVEVEEWKDKKTLPYAT
jgi:hypothetical protein